MNQTAAVYAEFHDSENLTQDHGHQKIPFLAQRLPRLPSIDEVALSMTAAIGSQLARSFKDAWILFIFNIIRSDDHEDGIKYCCNWNIGVFLKYLGYSVGRTRENESHGTY